MKNEHILDSMEYLDRDLIEEADVTPAKKKTGWVKWAGLAACVCICAAGAAVLFPALTRQKNEAAKALPQEITPAQGVVTNAPAPGGAQVGGLPEAQEKAAPAEYEEGKTEAERGGEITSEAAKPEKPRMLSVYDKRLNTGDMAVNNGCVALSESLKAAIDEYGSSTTYHIIAEVFKDGTAVGSAERLDGDLLKLIAAQGFNVSGEVHGSAAGSTEYIILNYAEAEKLLRFPAIEGYGILLSFYGETLPEDPVEEDPGYGGAVKGNAGFDVEMTAVADSVTPESVTVRVVNRSGCEILSGNEYDFSLEVLKEGVWKPLETGDRVNTGEALVFEGERDVTLNWTFIYGALPAGHYRAVKYFFPGTADGSSGYYDGFNLTAEFDIG